MSVIRNRKAIEKRITETVDEIAEAMDLGWLEVQVKFDETGKDDTLAASACDWHYRRLVMTWTLEPAAALTGPELRLVIIHELCHALIEPLWDSHPGKEKRHVTLLGELATENIARVVLFLMEGDRA